MLKRTLLLPPVLIAISSIQGGTALASELTPRSPSELARSLPRCAVVKVIGTHTRALEKYGGQPFTFTKFRIVENVWGDLPSEFSLRLFGGRLGDVTVEAAIIPTFRVKERLVLLLGADNRDGHPLVEVQGIFRLRLEKQPSRWLLTDPVTGLELLSAKDGSSYRGSPLGVPLEDFLYSLRAARTTRTSRK